MAEEREPEESCRRTDKKRSDGQNRLGKRNVVSDEGFASGAETIREDERF